MSVFNITFEVSLWQLLLVLFVGVLMSQLQLVITLLVWRPKPRHDVKDIAPKSHGRPPAASKVASMRNDEAEREPERPARRAVGKVGRGREVRVVGMSESPRLRNKPAITTVRVNRSSQH